MNKNIIVTGVLTLLTLGFAIGAYNSYTEVTSIKSEIEAVKDRTSALSQQSQTEKNNTSTSNSEVKGVDITDNRESAYKGNSQTAVLMDDLSAILTYKNGEDLKKSYAKYKTFIQGDVWGDLYGKSKSTGKPAIDQFAKQIDTLEKTGSVEDDVRIVTVGDNFLVTLTAKQGGNASAGAVNGENIYEFLAKPTDNGFNVKLERQLVKVDN